MLKYSVVDTNRSLVITLLIIIIIVIIMWSFIYLGGSMWNVTNSSMRINGIVHSSLIAYFAVLKVRQLAWISVLSFRICHLKRQLEFKLSVIKLLNLIPDFWKLFIMFMCIILGLYKTSGWQKSKVFSPVKVTSSQMGTLGCSWAT